MSAVHQGIAFSCLATLAGCNAASSENGNAVANDGQASSQSYASRLAAMSEAEQRTEFSQAARGAGEGCAQITTVSAPKADDGVAIWTIRCADGGELAIVLGTDRIERVLRTRPPTPRVVLDPCARLLGNWSNGRQSVRVTREGANYLIVYNYYYGGGNNPAFRFVGPCERGSIITHTDWVGDLSYLPSSNQVVFERQMFGRQ